MKFRTFRHLGFALASLSALSAIGCGSSKSADSSSLARRSPQNANPSTSEKVEQKKLEAGSTAGNSNGNSSVNSSLTANLFPTSANCTGKTLLPRRIWRLSDSQYRNTVSDILGPEFAAGLKLQSSRVAQGFDTLAANLLIDKNYFKALMTDADFMAQKSTQLLADVKSCASATGTTCVTQVAAKYGRLLWRRPLTSAEQTTLLSVFNKSVVDSDRTNAIQSVFYTLFVMPGFTYRSEWGGTPDAQGRVALTQLEIAGELASIIWDSAPDSSLLEKAESNSLGNPAQVRDEIKRMLADSRAKRGIRGFFDDWLDLFRVTNVEKAPAFNLTPVLRADLRTESLTFVDEIVWNKAGDPKLMFSAPYTFANANVASVYGVQSANKDFVEVALDPKQRAGILTQPAFLIGLSANNSTSFVHRGVYFLNNITCRPVGEKPENVMVDNMVMGGAKPGTMTTTREIQAAHSAKAACSSCHKAIDPAGAAFENFDPIGRYRTTENGIAIDSSGNLAGLGDLPPDFASGIDLIKNYSATERLNECFTRNYLTYAAGFSFADKNNCETAKVYEKMKSSNFKISSAPEALLEMDSIFYRNL